MPDTLSKYAKEISAAFDASIVAIRPTDARFDQFNEINIRGRNYVNVDADTCSIYTACAKLNPMGTRAVEQLSLNA